MDKDFKIRVFDSWSDCANLSKAWNRLLEESVHPTIYMTYEYLSLAWKRLHSETIQPLILTIGHENTLDAIAPFGLTSRREGGIKLNVVTYVVTLDSDIDKPYIIVKSDFERHAWRAISDFLQLRFKHWDLIDFYEMPDQVLGKQLLSEYFGRKKFYFETWKDAEGPYFDLTRDWNEFYKSHKNYRKKLSKLKRKLPECSIDTYYAPVDITDGLEKFIELESLSWKKDKLGISKDKQHLEFYRELMPELARLKRVVIKLLRNGDDLIAGEVLYRFKDSIFFAHSTYNTKFEEFRPGTVFAGLVLKDFSGKNYTLGDNLCGFSHYMTPWSSGTIYTSRINIFRRSPLTAALIMAWKLKRRITRVRVATTSGDLSCFCETLYVQNSGILSGRCSSDDASA
jgi:hypothetical protein